VARTEKTKLFEADVLVIGGGSSGLWAAKKASEEGAAVVIVDKGPRDWGGLAAMSGGDFDAVLPDEKVDDFVKDLVYYYDGLCEQDLMERLFSQSFDRLLDYQRMGCEFLTGSDGRLRGIGQRNLDHMKLYPARIKGRGGADMMDALLREVERLGVVRAGRTLVTDLLKQDGKLAGAVGFDCITGEFCLFETKCVIVATGSGGWKASGQQNTSTGESIYMAFRAGAEVRNFEFAKVWNVPRLFAWEGQTVLLPLGARFVNAMGEYFMESYSPAFGANTDPHYIVTAMAIEVREGRGPIYLDTSRIRPEDLSLVKPQSGVQRLNYEKLVELGIDFFKDPIEWVPQLVGSFGGLVADLEGQTAVPGLFVAGRARSIDPGVYIGGFALFTTAATGYITGAAAAGYAASGERSTTDKHQVDEFREKLYAPLGKRGITPKQVLREIQETLFRADVCILKSERSLRDALARIDRLAKEKLPEMAAADPHYLLKLKEVEGIAFLAEMYLRFSLMRSESRAGHYREDYPHRNDEKWLAWIVACQDGKGGLAFRSEPVPVDRYRFKPSRYYMDNFRFPVRETLENSTETGGWKNGQGEDALRRGQEWETR
jgi:succinate dehydrogenase / fumarate reductase flavoprotein subunit